MKNKKFWVSLIAGIMAAALLLGLIASAFPVHAAQTSDEIKAQIQQMQEKNEQMQADMEILSGKLDELEAKGDEYLSSIQGIVQQKALIDQQVGMLHAQIINMNEQIAAYNLLIADKQEDLDKAQARLAELNEKYKERIRAMEEDGNISYWSVLFEANSFSDLLDRLNMIQEIASADRQRLKQLREAAAEVEQAQAVLVANRAELTIAKQELDMVRAELQSKSDQAQVLMVELNGKIKDLEDQKDQYNNEWGVYEDALEKLENEIKDMEAEYDRVLYEEYLATLTTATTAPPTKPTGGGSRGDVGGSVKVDESGIEWVVPCDYSKVSSPFGWRVHPVHKDWRHHNGVDLCAECEMNRDGTTDSPIYATRSGVVVVSTWSDSAGWYVTIDHMDGYKSTYMHMCCRPFVSKGDVVAAGQVIGCIGTTGTSTGDHLHFGISKYNESKKQYEWVNPMDYIG